MRFYFYFYNGCSQGILKARRQLLHDNQVIQWVCWWGGRCSSVFFFSWRCLYCSFIPYYSKFVQ